VAGAVLASFLPGSIAVIVPTACTQPSPTARRDP